MKANNHNLLLSFTKGADFFLDMRNSQLLPPIDLLALTIPQLYLSHTSKSSQTLNPLAPPQPSLHLFYSRSTPLLFSILGLIIRIMGTNSFLMTNSYPGPGIKAVIYLTNTNIELCNQISSRLNRSTEIAVYTN